MALESARGVGHRMTALRMIHGLTQGDLAERLGVTQSFLSHIARGARPMPETLIVSASNEFGVPVSFFAVHSTAADLGPATFRKNSRASARDEARVVSLYDEAARVFRSVSERSGYRTADLPSPLDYDDDAELIAEALRTAAGFDAEEPILNATRTLERFGVGVVDNLVDLGEDTRGHTAVSRPSLHNNRPLVALVADVPGAVKRMTVLHELGHLIFDCNLAGPITGTRSPEEKRAYMFAGAFLLPEKVVRKRVSDSLNLHGYLPIKADYGMSVGAIVMRARDLGVISADRARSLQIQLSSQGWRTNEPVPVADERPVLMGQALRKVYGDRPTARAAHDLGAAPEWLITWTHADDEPAAAEPAKVIDFAARARARRPE